LRARPSVQRKIGDGHDLTSARFSGNVRLQAVFDNERSLKKGSSGTAVKLVQQALLALGYDSPKFGADGKFGKETAAAVRAFQQDTGAKVDGIVGPETIGFLDSRDRGQPVVAAPAPVIGNALPATNVIVQPGAPPVNAPALTGSMYGWTDTETVTINFDAVRSGPNWVPVVSGLIGNYSLQHRILPPQTEVTGPGGNTTAANFCAQVTELNALGNPLATALWYMDSAVLAHERVHATRLRPALVASAVAIEASVEALSVPHTAGMNAAFAATAISALPAFVTAIVNARTVWDAAYVALIAGDHGAGNPTATAEHTIVDPMVRRICRHATTQKWGACTPPC
jgi:peptidoglycan hydrolase-like protein with peptidoglycan-binding domain